MLDRLPYACAAIHAETARTAAAIEAERLRAMGLNATATALAAIAQVEGLKAVQARENAEAATCRSSARGYATK